MTALLWVPYIVNRIMEHGLIPALRNPKPDAPPRSGWANRLMQAHSNAIENLVVFAPLVIAIQLVGANSTGTTAAVMIYFWARLAHAFIYTFGIPYLRTVAFFVGFLVQCYLIKILLTL